MKLRFFHSSVVIFLYLVYWKIGDVIRDGDASKLGDSDSDDTKNFWDCSHSMEGVVLGGRCGFGFCDFFELGGTAQIF